MGREKSNIPALKEHMQDLTPKQRRFVEEVVKTGEPSNSAAVAYPDQKQPSQQGYENLKKPYIRQAIVAEMKEQGITDELITSKLKQGLAAEKIHTSHTEPDRVIPDMNTRLKYIKEINKLKGSYPDKVTRVEKRTANLHLYQGLDTKELEKRLEKTAKSIKELEAETKSPEAATN